MAKKKSAKGGVAVKSAKKSVTSKRTSRKKKMDAEKTKLPQPPKEPVNIFDRCVCFVVSMSKPGNVRKVNMESVQVQMKGSKKSASEINKSMLKLHKQLLDSEELQAITDFDTKVYLYMTSMAHRGASFPLKRGSYLIPIELMSEVSAELERRFKERGELVAKFMSVYPQRINEAEANLGEAFDRSNYLSEKEMLAEFKAEHSIIEFATPNRIKTLDSDLYEKEKAKLAKNMQNLHVEITNSMRTGFKEVLDRLVNALRPGEDGKKKKLFDSNTENLLKFIELFDKKNIVDDEECKVLVDKVKKVIQGRDADFLTYTLRNNDDFRDQIAKSFGEISEQLEEMVYEDESRMFAV